MIVAEHYTFDSTPIAASFQQYHSIVLKRVFKRRIQRCRRCHPIDPDRRAERIWFDKDRIFEFVSDAAHARWIGSGVGLRQRKITNDRNSTFPQQSLLDVFVHPNRRAKDARTHVRDSRQFEQSLNSAILAECAVQHWKNQIEASG